MNLSIFREYDIRGVYPRDLDDEAVVGIAKAFGTLLRKQGKKRISVGGDVRLSTESIKATFIDCVNSTGIDVIDIGYVTTPLCYFSAFHLDVDGFAMITASHNPANYNGFKLGVGKTTIFGDDIVALRDAAIRGDFASGTGTCVKQDITEDYIQYLAQRFQFKSRPKIVLDPANATGALFGKRLFERLGAEVIGLYDTVDGRFPNHHPDPTIAENVVELCKTVVREKAAVGIGLDGDSDRIGVVDEKGNLIPGDLLTLIYARDILADKPGSKIIFEVKSTLALDEGIRAAGGQPIMWKVGHSLLKKKMAEESAPLAGEVSGHVFFADRYFGYDDAIYAGCRILEIMDKTGKTPSQLLAGVPRYPNTPEIRCGCKDDAEKFRIAKKAVEHFSKVADAITIDGIRILYPDGWGLVRASNTQPSLVTRFEGKTPEACERIKTQVLDALKTFGEIEIGVSH
jgi:phosphomannomutase / phosphoglucomutase